jgi:hypothetical protein
VSIIILLDVDGVLVHDRGYRAGVVATIEHFAADLGLHGLAPTTLEVDAFQAAGFTNEWDLAPFVVGILRLAAASGGPVRRPTYENWAARSQDHQGRPSERALAALLVDLSRHQLPGDRKASLEAGLKELLADTYDVYRCPTTQVFQEFVLGSALYAAHYGLQPRFDTPSLLEEEDEPALTIEGRAILAQLVSDQGARVCVYTARPSGPPLSASEREEGLGQSGFGPAAFPRTGESPLAPEAELAVRAVGLDRFPLVAMGRMQWLARKHGEAVEGLTKPSPVQSLAAVGAAWGGDEARALDAAHELFEHGALRSPLAEMAGEEAEIYVLEDATPGLQAAEGAGGLLRACGLAVRVRGIGVTRSPSKADALSTHCEVIVPDVDAGLDWIASQVKT